MVKAKTKADVVAYYSEAEIDYKLVWHLKSQLAMHYGFWDTSTRRLRDALRNENIVLARMAHITSSDHVLDAGCGVGGSSIFLAKEFGCQATGISIVESQVKTANSIAQQQGLANLVHFQVTDYTAMPFADASFDVVWAIESICHADNKQAFLSEAFRVLKPGGRLIVADGFASKESYRGHEAHIMKSWLHGWGVQSLDTVEQFTAMATAVGLQGVVAHDVSTKIMPSARRLYALWRLGRPIDWITRKIGWRSHVTRGNFEAARYQYEAFSRQLSTYGIVQALRP